MIHVGKRNTLKIKKFVEYGAFLEGDDQGEILLPKRYVSSASKVGDEINVFLYFDSEDRLTATTEIPKAEVNEFALLKVISQTKLGAFLDWGLPKDLFLPFSEQTAPIRIDQSVLVHVYIDKSGRIACSMRLEKFVEKSDCEYKEGAKVSLQIAQRTDLGFKALIENRFWGILYANEVFQPLRVGQKIDGFIKKIRPDGKIDLSLQRIGHSSANEDISPLIIEKLKQANGFLAINDKTAPEVIYRLFGVSKKRFKIALGGLYKNRLIKVEEAGIYLL